MCSTAPPGFAFPAAQPPVRLFVKSVAFLNAKRQLWSTLYTRVNPAGVTPAAGEPATCRGTSFLPLRGDAAQLTAGPTRPAGAIALNNMVAALALQGASINSAS